MRASPRATRSRARHDGRHASSRPRHRTDAPGPASWRSVCPPEIVPGASHFMAHDIAAPSWRNAYQVATIGDHTFLKVQKLKPKG